MSNQPIDDDMPAEIDLSKAKRGLLHIPPRSRVFLPVAEQQGIELSELLTTSSSATWKPPKR